MKKAFTLLELVFVIVVIGILAGAIIPRMSSDRLNEAAIQVVSHIRYTQHLAMSDDRFDSSLGDWYKERWQFLFGKSDAGTENTDDEYAYTIFSDSFGGKTGSPDFTSMDRTEIAIDPSNKNKVLSGGFSNTIDWENEHANKKLNLGKTYGITNMVLSGGCSDQRIVFDHMGRPMRGDSSSLTSAYGTTGYRRLIPDDNPCILTLTSDEGSVSIRIRGETGYTCILNSSGQCVSN